MTELAENLKSQLMRLPVEDRAELAYCLISSLDEAEDAQVLASFESELEQRWQEMESGKVVGVPAEVALAEMRKNYP